MATGGRELTSDEIPSIKCCVCNEKGLTRDAEKYCVECCKYYCSTCLDLHSLFPTLKLHQFLDKSSFGSLEPNKGLPSFPIERCCLHPGKIIDLYCHDHDEVACGSCIVISHRQCRHVQSVPENIDELYRKEKIKKCKENVNKSKTRMKEITKVVERDIRELEESLTETVKSIKSFRQEIDKILNSLEEKTIEKVQMEYKKILQIFKENSKEANLVLDSIDEVASKLRNSAGNDAQEFVCSKISTKTINDTDVFERQLQKKKMAERVLFSRDDNVVSFLQQLESLGDMTSTSAECKQLAKKSDLYKVMKRKEIDVKITQDTNDCYIHGCCITEDESLLLADLKNSKLKRFDMPKEKIKDWLDLEADPLAVCLVSRTEAAVTLSNNSVQFVSLGKKLKSTRTLKMDHDCSGLAFANSKLIISDGKENVYVYKTSGQQMQLISPKYVFSQTRHIAVSDDGDRMYVADYYKGLVVLDSAGNYLSTVSDRTLAVCHGVCTVGRNILVCGYKSNNIVQIGHNLKILGEMAKVTGPVSLCFDSQRNRIIVFKHYDNEITILEIQ